MPRELSIGSSEGAFDIVDLGKPTPKYMVAIDNIGKPHSEEHLHLPSNQSDWVIYLAYADGSGGEVTKDASLHSGRVHVTVEHPDVLVAMSPIISRKESLGWSDVQSPDNMIRAGDKVRISFRFVCRKAGESRVLISLPLVHYDPLEFGIAKECDHAEAIPHKSKQWVLTVGNVFWGLVLLVIGSFALLLFRNRNKPQKGFAPVSTTER